MSIVPVSPNPNLKPIRGSSPLLLTPLPSPSRRPSLTVHALPPQILLPYLNRPAELSLLIRYNSSFFGLLERSIGSQVYSKTLMPVLCAPRESLDDLQFLSVVKRIICGSAQNSCKLWTEFCRTIGCDCDDVPASTYSPLSDRSDSIIEPTTPAQSPL
ncbi:uncharacterized protein V1516DRAFT_674712 [Lipomyces oligophaga]|uniref:uncharacterized protein n=1 Tax=Lipomyces oligophaga TaxID=45792 RepID=UPI0034CF696B